MKSRILAISFLLLLLCSAEAYPQKNLSRFNTVGSDLLRQKRCTHPRGHLETADEVDSDTVSLNLGDELPPDTLSMRIRYLERLIELKEKDKAHAMAPKEVTKPNTTRVISYYEGDGYELSVEGVRAMAEEAGLSNILFVLAQSVLETGYYQSKVCREYNNIFGLYDSRHGDYYHFRRWEDSVIAYQKYIQYRYKGGDYLLFLKRIGYAEDPGYIRKVARLARQIYKEYFLSISK